MKWVNKEANCEAETLINDSQKQSLYVFYKKICS